MVPHGLGTHVLGWHLAFALEQLMEEGAVYEGAKSLLLACGWQLLAGQPPGGTDSLPVVEIKTDVTGLVGSLGALKPDLIAHKGGVLLIIEAKPLFDVVDEAKLKGLLVSGLRLNALVAEMRQRSLLERRGIDVGYDDLRFAGALAHAGDNEPTDLGVLLIAAPVEASSLKAPKATTSVDGHRRNENPSLPPWA